MNIIASQTNNLSGEIIIPGSKSQTIRGLILASLSNGKSVLSNALESDDSEAAIKVCRDLGVKVSVGKNKFVIQSKGLPLNPKKNTLNSGDSGITTRFVMPALGLRKNHTQPITLDCGAQMKARPMKSLISALRNLGLNILSDSLPIKVSGKLVGGETEVEGLTSQFLSALLLNLPLAEKDSVVKVKNLRERPYVDMTLDWLKGQGIKLVHKRERNTDTFKIRGGQRYKAFQKAIPGDFSSASYFLAAGAMLGKKLVVKGLDMKDSQADKALVTILKKMGADIQVSSNSVTLSKGQGLKGIKINAKDIPDLLPTLAVLGTQAKGKTEILNVAQARVKETDRIRSMAEGLKKMGAKVKELDDGLVVYQSKLKGAKVKGYKDHRTVMALSIAGLLAKGKTTISDAESINKTFPQFIKLIKSLGANITLK